MLLAGRAPEEPGIDGILGFELFRDSLLVLDYPRGDLRIELGALPPADGRDIIDFRADRGVPMIDLDVAGTTVPADVDSGSMGWLMLPDSVVDGLPLAGEARVVGRASTSFNEFEIRAAPLDGVLRVGRHELSDPQIEFSDIFPHGNVGGQFLSQFEVTFDQKNGRMRLTREGEGDVSRQPRYRVGMMLDRGPEGGLRVDGTIPGSPADRAGLREGDRVLRINGEGVETLEPGAIGRVFGRPEEIRLVVRRGDNELELRLTPEKAP
jgi:hypothetical protein